MRSTIPLSQDGWRIIDVIVESLGISKAKAKQLLDTRSVFVNRKRVWMAKHQVACGDIIELPDPQLDQHSPSTTAHSIKESILLDDPAFIVCNKPAGIDSEGPDSFEALVQKTLGRRYRLVHRLDRDTSGALIIAKNQATKDRFIKLFQANRVHKEYRALVHGLVLQASSINDPIDGKRAVTHCTPIAAYTDSTLLKVIIETGRTHQIRRHLAAIGHPVVGERIYLTHQIRSELLRSAPRQLLHAASLQFPHPNTNQPVHVTAPIPEDMEKIIQLLSDPRGDLL